MVRCRTSSLSAALPAAAAAMLLLAVATAGGAIAQEVPDPVDVVEDVVVGADDVGGAVEDVVGAAGDALDAVTGIVDGLLGGRFSLDDPTVQRVFIAYDGALPAGILDSLEAIEVVPSEATLLLDPLLADTTLGIVRAIELPSIGAVALTAPGPVIAAALQDSRVRAVALQRRIVFDLYASVEQINGRGVEVAEEYEWTTTDDVGPMTERYERPGVTGAGVTVAIVDTGIAALHPDVGSRIKAAFNFELSEIQDEGGIPADQWDAYAEGTGPSAMIDEVGHGTHVAGTVGGDGAAAVMAGSSLDLRGVAPGVDFVAMRIGSPASGVVVDIDFEEAAVAALDYIVRHHAELGIKVVNNSWGLLPVEPGGLVPLPVGEETDYDAAAEVARAVVAEGVTMVFSAGNDGPGFDSIRPSPNGIPEVITVAAACKAVDGGCAAGGITGFSSRGAEDGSGPQVDVSAPGDQIMAALSPSILAPLTECPEATAANPGYFCISGTSMASPHVAGVAALMYEASPAILPAQVEQCLTSTADDMVVEDDDLLVAGWDVTSGYGMVNTRRAIECAHQLTGPAPLVAPADANAPAPTDDTAPSAPDTAPAGAQLPATGGGLALAGLATLAMASRLRRRP